MKIFFPLENLDGIDSTLDERFGRAPFIMIYDTGKNETVMAEANPFAHQDHGVGVSIANLIVQQECRAAVGNRFGPKAGDILKKAGVQMIDTNSADRETVKDVIRRLEA
jgi:predicted Fe-Mo cluster-binding NifX family protein